MAKKTDILFEEFLGRAQNLKASIDPLRVLRARVYQIGNANVLIRAAGNSVNNGRFFFGINYITLEEMANLENPFIAFICGSVNNTVIIPAQLLFANISEISHDRNGEYKINLDSNLNIVLKGRNNRLDCQPFLNAWELLLKPLAANEIRSTAEESIHTVLQGRLLEIGNIRGFRTYSPDKSKTFNQKKLSEIATLDTCPKLEFSDYNTLRNIDVIWFSEKNKRLIPEQAFEVEISTGTWSGVGRLATLIDYRHVRLYIISQDNKKYTQVMHSFADYESRYKYVNTEALSDLYASEKSLKDLRYRVGI